jgi:hypothetical protein
MRNQSIRTAKSLVRRYEGLINRRGFYPRRLFGDHLALALMSKAVAVAKATLCLLEQGFNDEAFGLTRTLSDISYTVRFISNQDTEERAKRFAQFYGKDRERLMTVIATYYPSIQLRPSRDHARLMEFAKLFKNPHRWSGKSARAMAEEADTVETDLVSGKPVNLLFDYEVLYAWLSHYVHPTIVALDQHIVDESGKFRIAKRQRLNTGDLATFNAIVYIVRIYIWGLRILGSELPGKLATDTKAFLKRHAKRKAGKR